MGRFFETTRKSPIMLLLAITVITIVILNFSCKQDDNKKKELELKEKELALKEKELELKENNSRQDTVAQIPTTTKIKSSSNPEDIVLEIKGQIENINSLSLTKKTFEVAEGCGDKESAIDYFLLNNEIVKIEKHFINYDENGRLYYIHDSYYYKSGKFIYYYSYVSKDSKTGAKTDESRIYVNDDKIIRAKGNISSRLSENDKENLDNLAVYDILEAFSTHKFAQFFCS